MGILSIAYVAFCIYLASLQGGDKMIELKNPKGTMDYLPQEQKTRQNIVRGLQDVFEKYGYQPLETPILCHFEVLASKYAGGAEILKEVYKMYDQGDRELGLRYDLTVPFAKVVGMNSEMRMPFKRYEIGKVFRDGPVKAGRNREFTQCDVDVVGISSMIAEAEYFAITVDVFEMLGLPVYISYNNRKLLSGLVEASSIDSDEASSVILSIDKLEKIGKEGVSKELEEEGINEDSIKKLFSFIEMEPKELLQYLSQNPINKSIEEGLSELNELNSYINAAQLNDYVKLTPVLARGLEIYTGTIWEVFLKDGSITSSLGGGGRYDKIIGGFLESDNEYPAVGMSFGLDVIYEALKMKGAAEAIAPAEVFLIPMGTEKECFNIAMELRRQGFKVDMEATGRRLKRALDYANKSNMPYVIILGENEIKEGKVKIKDMRKGIEIEASINEIGDRLKKVL